MQPEAGRGEAAFWLPLLALYSGARLNELAPLTVRDVKRDEPSGLHYMTVIEDTEGGRTVKTEGSLRAVPIHPELIRIGILEFVASILRLPMRMRWQADTLRAMSAFGTKRTSLVSTFNPHRRPPMTEAKQAVIEDSVHPCPLSGVKQTSPFALHMSAFDPKRTSASLMSDLPGVL
jgi:hypothetical protein